MSKSVADVDREYKEKYKTLNNTFEDFPIGSKVWVICACQDFNFFDPSHNLTGRVIENHGKYLGIIVKFDKPRLFEDGSVQKDFNFAPDDLVRIDINTKIQKKIEKQLSRIEKQLQDIRNQIC